MADPAAAARRRQRRLALLAAGFGLATALVLLEIVLFALGRTGVVNIPAPRYGGDAYWDGGHPEFGVWHRPRTSWRHRTPCFDVTYTANSYGTRDVERSRAADRPRVVVLGDSFTEGWGVPLERRATSLLETATGLEHLNFGMSHFGPYQELLVYERLVRPFAHDAVLILVVPVNDFLDLDIELARQVPGYAYRYRPYLVGEPPNLVPYHWRENGAARLLRRFTWTWNAALHAREAWRGREEARRNRERTQATGELPSFFYDAPEHSMRLLEEVLGRLREAVEGRPLAVALVPTLKDLARRHVSGGPSPLGARLAARGASDGYIVVDLLEAFAASEARWDTFFFPCDYHWNEAGNAAAARHLRARLEGSLY